MAERPSVAEELAKLVDLRDRGVLTDQEFSIQKARVLGVSSRRTVMQREDGEHDQDETSGPPVHVESVGADDDGSSKLVVAPTNMTEGEEDHTSVRRWDWGTLTFGNSNKRAPMRHWRWVAIAVVVIGMTFIAVVASSAQGPPPVSLTMAVPLSSWNQLINYLANRPDNGF
ncbi:MAG TPA: SHOCT domain-containing protein [Acidimicrobiales bacterium]|nr:SHOCT domain-containing protein [Acidimicrobiales bacterium]